MEEKITITQEEIERFRKAGILNETELRNRLMIMDYLELQKKNPDKKNQVLQKEIAEKYFVAEKTFGTYCTGAHLKRFNNITIQIQHEDICELRELTEVAPNTYKALFDPDHLDDKVDSRALTIREAVLSDIDNIKPINKRASFQKDRQHELDKAEQQLKGFKLSQKGYCIIDLIEGMMLHKEEWEALKEQFDMKYLNDLDRKLIQNYFDEDK